MAASKERAGGYGHLPRPSVTTSRARSGLHRNRLAGGGALVACLAVLLVGPGLVGASAASAKGHLRLARSPLSGGVIFAQAVHAGTITPATGSEQSPPGPAASTILPNVEASSGTQPVNETPITADPNNGQHLVTGGNDYNCTSVQGFYTSGDGGTTWSQHCLSVWPGLMGEGDPILAYDTTGNEYAGGIDADSSALNGRIVFQKSANNGATWGAITTAVTPLFSGGLTDKPWMESDHGSASPRPGALYISVTQFDSSFSHDAMSVSHSYDGGATWSMVQVDPTQTTPTVDQFSDLAVGNDGTVYVTWMRCSATGPTGDCGGTSATLLLSKSTDGGVTWSAPTTMVSAVMLAPDSCGAYYGCVPGTSERASEIPVIDVDHATGALYVAYYDFTGTNMQVRVIKSTDGGATFGAPKKVFGGKNTHDQFFPWLSVSSTGSIGVTALVRTTGTGYVAKAVVSSDGGATYKPKVKTSTFTSSTLNDGFGGAFLGDYTGNIWAGTTLHQAWPDTRTGVSEDETGGFIP